MAYFALLWKARTIEKYRSNYENEKINSMLAANAELPRRNMSQKWKRYRYNCQKNIARTLRKWCPEGSRVSNFIVYLTTDQTFANFLVKSVIGFVGGIILTYFWFMFFVFQLSISLIHATIMSSFIGVLLTLGLAFSYRIRCLVFLLIPQFFSRVGRYTLTCYALVLILTGPATNTLKNSEVLSESLACGQEQVRLNVNKISEAIDKPLQLLKETINSTMKRIKSLAAKVKEVMVNTHRLIMSIAHVLQSSLAWLTSVEAICNSELGTPYEHCARVLSQGNQDKKLPRKKGNVDYLIQAVCINVKPDSMCIVGDFARSSIVATVKKKLDNYSDRVKSLLSLTLHARRTHACCSNASRSASQAAAGIVTEIRHRADPLLTWLSWSSYLTSLFLVLIIFRAKYYQQMFETRSRFDNRYVTKEFRDLDFRRLRQGRETVLPLNTRERAKYVSTSSFRLLASERVHLTRSIVFMVITTFKLSIHMVADYSLYWVLMNMRFHGRFQALTQRDPTASILVSGSGPLAGILRGLMEALSIPLALPAHSPITCLPNPLPPDFQRYAQIGVLILLLWVFALFEPYGLRLRHVIMSHYQPERARARAEWLYNHIIRTRGCFLKYARRKLHREYKYSTEQRHTFRNWMNDVIPCQWLRCLLGVGPEEPRCLLCSIRHIDNDPDTYLKRCESPGCPGVYCTRCFMDIGQLCTICLSPKDYGDLSDMSLEKSSSEESDDEDFDNNHTDLNKPLLKRSFSDLESDDGASTSQKKFTKKGFQVFSRTKNKNNQESMPLLNSYNFKRKNDCVLTQPLRRHPEIEQQDDDDQTGKNDCVLTQPLKRRPEIEQHDNYDRATSYIVQSKEICNEPNIPVIVRDNQRLLKFGEVPKEKLTAIRNTMTLLTTKLDDDKFNKEWNTHDSKTFEYLVMEFFQPVDIFKKALFVRHTKYADSQVNNDEKIDSLKDVMDFLCSYQMNDVSSNNDANEKTTPTLHPNTFENNTNTPSNKNDYGNAEKFTNNERISDRNMQNIRFFFHLKQTVPGDLFIRLNRRKVCFNPNKYVTKKLNRNASNRMYGNIAGTSKRLEYKRSRHNQGHSLHDLSKCRIYKINKETFAKNLRIKLKKISLQKKNVTGKTTCLALEKKLGEQMQKCPSLNGGAPIYSNSNVLTECSSDINPSDLKYLPPSVEETHEIKTNESSDKNIPTTNDNNVISDRKLLKIGGYCSCIWKRTKLTLKPRKLENDSRIKEPCPNIKANHKRRKKIRISGKDTRHKAKLNAKKVNDDARNYRMSLFLKEHDWLRSQIDGDVLNKNKNLEKGKVEIKMTKLEYRRKLKEENELKKAAKKQLTRQLKIKLKAEQKFKKESMKKKHDHSRSLNTEGLSFKQTPKDNTKSKGKSSIEASACFARKLIRNVTRDIASRNKLKKVAPRRHLPSYLNFYGFTCPVLNNRESSLDLDEIFQPPWDADFGETKVYYQEESNRLCEEFFWPYCRKADDSTQTCVGGKNGDKKCKENTTIPESEEWVKEILNPKAISMRTVASDVLLGIKKSVEKIRSFQAPQKFFAEKEVSAAPVMRTCSCQNVSINKKSKQSQAQVVLKHCGTQYEYEPMMNVLFTTNLSKPIEKEQTCAFCTCAVQSTFPKKEDVVKVDVWTMHFNALKTMQHASAQWQQQAASFKGFGFIDETNGTDTTLSGRESISISDGIKTDTTVCSWLNYGIAYEPPKTPKGKVKVTKKANQSTSTDRIKCTDVSTTIVDWWSPLVERKKKKKLKVGKRDDGDKQSIGVETDGKYVSFRSYAQIIPEDLFTKMLKDPEHVDILSPSRYLLESQKYYNELFLPHGKQKIRDQCFLDAEKPNPGIGFSRPSKAKRLEESYVPRKKMQTSFMNTNPLSWQPAREEVPSHNVKHHQRRNAKLQAGLKAKNNHEKMSKGVGINVKKNDRVKPSKSVIINGKGSIAGECESTSSY